MNERCANQAASGGKCIVSHDLNHLIRFGLGAEDRGHLGPEYEVAE